jgi:hypothetical protein
VPDDAYSVVLKAMRNLTRRCRDDVTGIRELLHIRNEGDSQQTGDKIKQAKRDFLDANSSDKNGTWRIDTFLLKV